MTSDSSRGARRLPIGVTHQLHREGGVDDLGVAEQREVMQVVPHGGLDSTLGDELRLDHRGDVLDGGPAGLGHRELVEGRNHDLPLLALEPEHDRCDRVVLAADRAILPQLNGGLLGDWSLRRFGFGLLDLNRWGFDHLLGGCGRGSNSGIFLRHLICSGWLSD